MAKIPAVPQLKDRHHRLLDQVKQNWGRLALAMVSSFFMAVTSVAMAWGIKPVIDDIFVAQDVGMLRLMPLVVVGIFFVRGVGYFGQEYFMQYVGQKVVKNIRAQLYDKIIDLPLSFFQGEKTGGLMSRVTWDVNLIRELVSRAVTSSIRDFFSILGLTCLIFYRDWQLALYAIVILPIAYYPVMYFGKKVRKASTRCQEAMSEVSAFLHETFAGNKIVKAFGMEPYEKERFFERNERVFEQEIRAAKAKSLSSPLMEFLAGIGIAVVILYGGYAVIRGERTPGEFFSFMAAVLMLYDPVKKLSYLNNAIQEGMAAADRIYDIIEREPDIIEPPDAKILEDGPHTVRFNRVGFSYDGKTPVLSDIDLTVSPGEVVALVGASGGGKTTLVNLIARFFDVTAGAVEIDGADLRDFTVKSLRKQIAIVTQEPILFNDTIHNNIAYGDTGASQRQIEAAAKDAFAHEFITSFPKGYESLAGELGGRLSGGEKQRLCIARAILKDAPILILDEATSSLDTEAERIVQKAMENLMAGRTAFVIAHRLSTVRHADRILVISGGRIVEQGRHEELLAASGHYARLHELQFSDQEDGPENADASKEKPQEAK